MNKNIDIGFRWLCRCLKITLIVILIGAFAVWGFLWGSLPQLDGRLSVRGLTGPVTVNRDALGVPTVVAMNRDDMAYALGFVHAQDRFFQMDLLRRTGAGELSALFGAAGINSDRVNRLYRFRIKAQAAFSQLPIDDQRLLKSYTRGVNDGLNRLLTRPFEYAVLGVSPKKWEPADSLLVIWAMYLQLQGSLLPRQIALDWMKDHTNPQQLAFLLPQTSHFDAPLDAERLSADSTIATATAPAWFGIPTAEERKPTPSFQSSVGSNNFAIGGSRTSGRGAIVGDDMHLPLSLPNIWYRAQINYKDYQGELRRLTGVTLPGVPLVVVGSNGHVAWGFTVSYADCLELIELQTAPGNPERYKTDRGWNLVDEVTEKISVKGGAPIDLKILETPFGPLQEIGSKFYAVHWIAEDSKAVNLNLGKMDEARNIWDALSVANTAGIPAQNIIVGDSGGHIGWTIAGALPARGDSMAGVDFTSVTARTDWNFLLDPSNYPRLVDPPAAQLWTANNRQLAGSDYKLIGDGGADIGARATQLRDDLIDLKNPNEARAYQAFLDDRALFMSKWRANAIAALDDRSLRNNPKRAEFRRLLLEEWTGDAGVNSVGYTLARGYLDSLYRQFFGKIDHDLEKLNPDANYAAANARWPIVIEKLLDGRPPGWLPNGAPNWQDVQLRAIDDAIYHLDAAGMPLSEATWGKHNTEDISHPFSRQLPLGRFWLSAPADAIPGDDNMPRVAGSDFGQSERMVVSPKNEENGILNMPGGQSGHPLSPYFLAGHKSWVEAKPTPFLPGAPTHTLYLDRENGSAALNLNCRNGAACDDN